MVGRGAAARGVPEEVVDERWRQRVVSAVVTGVVRAVATGAGGDCVDGRQV